VSLSGDYSEIISALGLGYLLVGVDLSSVYPKEEMRAKPKIGVEFRLLAEPILVLEPTLAIGDSDASPPEVIEQVRGAGVPVVIFPRFEGLTGPAEKIRALAAVLGWPSGECCHQWRMRSPPPSPWRRGRPAAPAPPHLRLLTILLRRPFHLQSGDMVPSTSGPMPVDGSCP
jgi:hypothetical protein